GSCACAPRPSSTSGWSITPTGSREPAGAWTSPGGSSPASASPPSAAGAGGPRRRFEWPSGFARVPDQDWTLQPVDTFGLRYDTVENHGWYRNLDPTVEDLARHLDDGDVLIDYSGGTGILLDRL